MLAETGYALVKELDRNQDFLPPYNVCIIIFVSLNSTESFVLDRTGIGSEEGNSNSYNTEPGRRVSLHV